MKLMSRSLSWMIAFSMLSGAALASEPAETRKLDLMVKGTPERLQSGAHGKVVLVGDLDASGVMSHLSVASSSGSEELDASFLAELEGSRVKATGEPKQATRIELTLTAENFEIKDGIKIVYPCDQLVRDIEWSRSNRANWDIEQEFLFGSIKGLGLIVADQPRLRFLRNPEAYRQAWLTAIDRCRNDNTAFFVPLLMAAGNGE